MPAPKLVNMFAVPFAFGHYAAHAPLNAGLKRFAGKKRPSRQPASFDAA
jgi:hypothetical protein